MLEIVNKSKLGSKYFEDLDVGDVFELGEYIFIKVHEISYVTVGEKDNIIFNCFNLNRCDFDYLEQNDIVTQKFGVLSLYDSRAHYETSIHPAVSS